MLQHCDSRRYHYHSSKHCCPHHHTCVNDSLVTGVVGLGCTLNREGQNPVAARVVVSWLAYIQLLMGTPQQCQNVETHELVTITIA